MSPLFTYYGLSSSKISKETLEWIRRTRCTRFWAEFGIKIPYFSANRSFLSTFTTATFIYSYSPTIMQNFRKVPNVDSENQMYEKSLVQFRIKMSHLEAKRSFFSQYSFFPLLFTNNAKFKNFGPKIDPW